MPAKPFPAKVLRYSGDKTLMVQRFRLVKHKITGKLYKHRTKMMVHDELNQAVPGDEVLVQECRPISKSKAHKLLEVLRPASIVGEGHWVGPRDEMHPNPLFRKGKEGISVAEQEASKQDGNSATQHGDDGLKSVAAMNDASPQ
eukprot:TRINITY_DN9287_c0_g2_i1.p1 TRINITY_DN9287_c0_g2~~TRINITY_DN9287_c0_g2_i1.p1  ORF type:complete len:144 (+),score=16.83 TRINITY_DN9287_c0_g2_i1:110-541(+)